MNRTRVCEDCGVELPTDTTEGLCPRCLLGAAAGLCSAGVSPASSPSVSLGGDSGGGTPPELAAEDGRATQARRFGDYELLEEIASGGMGIVYKARQVSLKRIVALKTLPFGRFTRETFIKRFRAEAEAAARLHHPNIVAIHEVGEHEGQPYFSMDYVDGPSLAEVANDQPLAIPRAVRFMRTMAEAIHYAHGMGILHRDLKPSNILIDQLDQPHITDFGLAKDLKRDSELTLTGQTLGSPNYIPPEQIDGRSGKTGPHSDVYSLGAVLYHLLTGRPPFVGESVTATLQQVATNEPVAPRLLNPSVSCDLETICLKCLEREPARRYGTAQELAEELDRYQQQKPIRARPVGMSEKLWRWCRRRPAWAGLISLTAVLSLMVMIGSPIAAFRIKQAEKAATEKLRESYLAQAQAGRWSGRAGRQFDSLQAIAKAATLKPPPRLRHELRDEAIACLALTDIRVIRRWRESADLNESVRLDHRLMRYGLADSSGAIRICGVANDQELFRLDSPGVGLQRILRFSPDDQLLAASSSDGQVRIWNLANRQIVLKVPGSILAQDVDFSADSRQIAVITDVAQAMMYDVNTGRKLQTFTLGHLAQYPGGHASCIRLSPDGETLAIAYAATREVWTFDTASGSRVKALYHTAGVNEIVWHPEGRYLVTSSPDRLVHIWDTISARKIKELSGHNGESLSIAFNRTGDLLASSGADGRIRLWNYATWEQLVNIDGGGAHLQFSPDGRRLGCDSVNGPRLQLYEVSSGEALKSFYEEAERQQTFAPVSFSPDGRLLAAANGEEVRLWNPDSGAQITSIETGLLVNLHFDSGGTNLYVAGARGVFRWPIQTSQGLAQLTIGPPQVLFTNLAIAGMDLARNRSLQVCVSPQGDCFLLSGNRVIRELLRAGSSRWRAAAITPDAKWLALAAAASKEVSIYLPESGNAAHRISTSAEPLKLAFSPNGNWLAIEMADQLKW